jgi:hypothetical protein
MFQRILGTGAGKKGKYIGLKCKKGREIWQPLLLVVGWWGGM